MVKVEVAIDVAVEVAVGDFFFHNHRGEGIKYCNLYRDVNILGNCEINIDLNYNLDREIFGMFAL